MRKAMIGLLVVLCLWGATSWQGPPQWKVIVEQHITGGTVQLNGATVFTPQKAGLYRVSGYCSATGPSKSNWNFRFEWDDLSGVSASTLLTCEAGLYLPAQSGVVIFSPKVGTTVHLGSYEIGGALSYNAAFTIEQLQ
jgi:hypothetical protein